MGSAGQARAQLVPDFLIEPVPQRVVAGHTLDLLASASPLSAEVQWFRDGVALAGATGSVLRIENARPINEGFYQALASLPGGARWSREVFVRIANPAPAPGRLDFGFFTPGLSGSSIDAVACLADGRIAIGGKFQIGAGIRNLAVLLPDGTPDPNFAPTSYPDGRVWALAQSAGRLIAGGEFASVDGVACGGVAALDSATGRLAQGWLPGLGFVPGTSPVPRVLTLATDADGRILAGGTFARWRTPGGTVDRPWLIRLAEDGTPDPGFAQSPVSGGEVRSVATLPGGGAAVAGSFTAPTGGFAVLDQSGALAGGFALSQSPNVRVRAVLPLPDGSFLIGGDFTNVGSRLARYFADGQLDPSFAVGTNNDVNALALAADGKVLVGGLFTTVGGVPMRRLARLNADLSRDDSFRSDGLDDEVKSLCLSPGAVFAGGDFEAPHWLLVKVSDNGDAEVDEIELVRSPLARETPVGNALDLTVAVSPVRPGQGFLWLRDGEVVAESGGPRFSIDRISEDQAGTYQVKVSDPTGETMSGPVRVGVTRALPGREPEFRYRGTPRVIPAATTATAPLAVPDVFEVRHARVTLDLSHPDTSLLEIHLVSPGGSSVRLFNNNGRRGRDLDHTTFDDDAGGDAAIDDAQPPFTGTYQPDRPLSLFTGTAAAGQWMLRIENDSLAVGQLTDWTLELRAGAPAVNFANYLAALDLADDADSRRAYALASLAPLGGSAVQVGGVSPAGFAFSYWRWSAPLDASYAYERNAPAGSWDPVVPAGEFITRFPGGRELREVVFPATAARAYFRVKAAIAPEE